MGNNPLVPAGYDVAWTVVTLALIALTVVALLSLGRSSGRADVTATLVWAALIVIVPLFGPIAWFVAGQRSHSRQRG